MSLQVKFPFSSTDRRKSSAPNLTCSACNHTSSNSLAHEHHTQNCTGVDKGLLLPLITDENLPTAPGYSRNYSCERCLFNTSGARKFLVHQRDEHGDKITIYPCDQCEYASRYKDKVFRHRSALHKDAPPLPSASQGANTITTGTLDEDVGEDGLNNGDMEMETEEMTDGSKLDEVLAGSDAGAEQRSDTRWDDDDDDELGSEDEMLGETELTFDDEPEDTTIEEQTDVMEEVGDARENAQTTNDPTAREAFPDDDDDVYDYIESRSPTVDNPVTYRCKLCQFSSTYKWNLISHVRAVHLKGSLFKCSYCDFVTARKKEWCLHKTTHSSKPVFKCTECFYRTTMRRNYERHVARHADSGPVQCGICTYSSTGEAAVQRHMAEYHDPPEPDANGAQRTHKMIYWGKERAVRKSLIEGTPFHCEQCPAKYKRSSDLRFHMRKKHGALKARPRYRRAKSTPVNNSLMNNSLVNNSLMNNSLVNNSSVNNSLDEGLGEQYEPLNLSVIKFEPMDDESEPIGEEPLDLSSIRLPSDVPVPGRRCPHCGYEASGAADLRKHLLTHTITKMRCRLCSWRCRRHVDMTSHMQTAHPSVTGLKTKQRRVVTTGLRCSYCPYVGKYRAEVVRHARTHFGSKPFVCQYCHYATNWKGDMKRHIERHHASHVKQYGGDIARLTNETYSHNLDMDDDAIIQENGIMEPEDILPEDMFPEDMLVDEGLSVKTEPEEEKDEEIEKAVENGYIPESFNKIATGGIVFPGSENDHYFTGGEEEEPVEDPMPIEPEPAPITISNTSRNQSPVKNVQCQLCDFVCEAPSKLRWHMEIHVNLKRFQCPICGQRSNWVWDIRSHIRSVHPGAPTDVNELPAKLAQDTLEEYLASRPSRNASPTKVASLTTKHNVVQTPLTFVTPPMLESPSKTAKPGRNYKGRCRPYKCSECGRRSNWKWDMSKHIRSLHPNATLITMSEEEAMATVHEIVPYYSTAGARASAKAAAARRLSASTPAAPARHPSASASTPAAPPAAPPATVPSEPVVGADELKKLLVMKCRPFKCSRCGRRSNWKWELKKHIRVSHANVGRIIVLNSAQAKMPYTQNTPASLESTSLQIQPNIQDDLKKHCCPKCSYRSTQSGNIKRHLRQVHQSDGKAVPAPPPSPPASPTPPAVTSPPGDNLFRCRRCSYSDRNKGGVVQHFRVAHPGSTAYMCRLCGDASNYRNSVYRHIRKKHQRQDYSEIIVETAIRGEPSRTIASPETAQTNKIHTCEDCGATSAYETTMARHRLDVHGKLTPGTNHTSKPVVNGTTMVIPTKVHPTKVHPTKVHPTKIHQTKVQRHANENDPRPLKCDLCPFSTNKQGLLKIHKNYHKPQVGNNFKCKHCPYYVSAMRLLHQHTRLHLTQQGIIIGDHITSKAPVIIESKTVNSSRAGRKKYSCEKCPYTTPYKKEALYHKQFHRPRASAPYKCDLCPYWVTYPRFLTQHRRVHEQAQPALTNGSAGSTCGSLLSSPCKADLEDVCHDPASLALAKQRIIASKITSIPITPEKHQSRPPGGSTVPGYDASAVPSGSYETLHRCIWCPYGSVRATTLRQHVAFHGANTPHGCTRCDYHAPTADLLAAHIRVHSHQYRPGRDDSEEDATTPTATSTEEERSVTSTPTSTSSDAPRISLKDLPRNADFYVHYDGTEHVLKKATMKKWCCERCPYSTAKKTQFERHTSLHTSQQKYACEYCDYSVPAYHLLAQHRRLHVAPNANLLSAQSLSNLQQLPLVPADVAAAAAVASEPTVAPPDDMYENSNAFVEPRRQYQCDRCPFASTRRDYLLTHLRCHVTHGDMKCPHCDYSVSKASLLTQHIRVHFAHKMELVTINDADTPVANGNVVRSDSVCQYCDRSFTDSQKLRQHEQQHLVGN